MRIVLLFIQVFIYTVAQSQVSNFNFKRLSTNEGLSDGIVHCFVQDRYGFIWIGTTYGLNRFDGISIKSYFTKRGDSSSICDNYVQSLFNDGQNNLWIGTGHGLCRYNYSTNSFENYKGPSSIIINDFKQDKKGRIWLATSYGLWIVNEKNKSIQKFTSDTSLLKEFQYPISQIASSGDLWYLATNKGIKILNPLTNTYGEFDQDATAKFSIKDSIIISVAIDSNKDLWAISLSNSQSLLTRINLKTNTVKTYRQFSDPRKKLSYTSLTKALVDKNGRIWVISTLSGLSLYNPKKDEFDNYQNDPLLSNSIVGNHNVSIYQDRDGIIWIGSAGYGCSYFNPDKTLFSTIYSVLKIGTSISETWCRAACEDRDGNLWLGTGQGVIKYNPDNQACTVFANNEHDKFAVQYNSIRSLLEDDEGDIWIGTAKGLNRYHPKTGVMDFFSESNGIPHAFFWMMAKDKERQVWFGSGVGLYKYLRDKNRFDDLSSDPFLSKYAHKNVQALYVDSKNRLWVGLLDVGLVMYDLDQKKLKLLTVRDSLISDTRFSSFAEDKSGTLWIGSEGGLTAYDPEKNTSVFFSREDGLPSDRTNNLMVDSSNRLWVGTSNGLCVLSADRKKIKRFDVNDGLLTNQFNEQAAFCTHDGLFIFPTYKGFTVFHPENYQDNTSITPLYITSFKNSNQQITNNTESLEKINLHSGQNFFTITLAGLNYLNPAQCAYEYRLDPFDKEWIVTSKRELNYTNVPAGDYTFRYKVVTDNYEGPEKTLRLSIAEIFYKTWWFKTILLLLMAAALVSFYRYRFRHREKIVLLQNKAQLLEKEKTIVQYENLKQQLNPHFLFNSLTSLRSLIRVEPNAATHFLDGLSKTYRYLLKSGNNELVTLEQELNFVDTFTELQKTRFKGGLFLDVTVSHEDYNKLIVPATLQHLVDNAIKHNTACEESPLMISIYTEDNYVVVKNNLQRYRIVETSNNHGLKSLTSLYKYLSVKAVLIHETENHFIVKIPLI